MSHRSSLVIRLLAAVGLLMLLATACGSDDPSTVEGPTMSIGATTTPGADPETPPPADGGTPASDVPGSPAPTEGAGGGPAGTAGPTGAPAGLAGLWGGEYKSIVPPNADGTFTVVFEGAAPDYSGSIVIAGLCEPDCPITANVTGNTIGFGSAGPEPSPTRAPSPATRCRGPTRWARKARATAPGRRSRGSRSPFQIVSSRCPSEVLPFRPALFRFRVLEPAAQVLGQEALGGGEELHAVLGLGEAVALVGEQQVLVVDALLGQRGDDLLGLGLLHPGIVGPLGDEQGDLDVAGPGERRPLPHELLLGVGVPDPGVELGDHRRPVRRDRLDEGLEVRRADDVDRAGEDVGGEGGADQGGVAAVGAAEDGDPIGVGVALVDHVLHGVDEVVVHLGAPLAVAGVDEVLAVAGGAPEVDLHAQVAAVGQPLRLGVEPPRVPGPRPAVHVQHGRQPGALEAGRERQVPVDLQTISRGERERLHVSQLVTGQRRLVLEQERRLPRLPVEGVVADGPVVGDEGGQPGAVGVVGAEDVQLAGVDGLEVGDVVGHRRVEDLELVAVLLEHDEPGLTGVGVEVDGRYVVDGVLGDDLGVAGGEVHLHEAAGVGADRRQHPQAGAVEGEGQRAGGEGVVLADLEHGSPLRLFVVADHPDHAAVGQRGQAAPHAEVGVDEQPDEPGVLHHLCQLAGGEVEPVHVVQLRVVDVEPDEDLVGKVLVGLLHPGLDPGERGEVADLVGLQVDVVEAPVLVAADVLGVEQVAVVVGPEERADPAVPVDGDGPGLVRTDGAQPHVEDALVGGEPGQAGAVGRDARAGPFGVAEEHFTGDEGDGRERSGHG